MIEISICVGSACHLKGSPYIIKSLEKLIYKYNVEKKVKLKGEFCMGDCTKAVCVKVEEKVYSLNKENVERFFKEIILGRIEK